MFGDMQNHITLVFSTDLIKHKVHINNIFRFQLKAPHLFIYITYISKPESILCDHKLSFMRTLHHKLPTIKSLQTN